MVTRYGEEIEADLHREYTLDLLEFFRGRYSWRKLRALLQKLPSTALTWAALVDDDLVVEGMDLDKEPPDTGPSLSEYSAEAQRLDTVTDLLQQLITVTVDAAGGKSGRVRPAKRPETAFTRARAARVQARFNSLLDEVSEAQARWAAKN